MGPLKSNWNRQLGDHYSSSDGLKEIKPNIVLELESDTLMEIIYELYNMETNGPSKEMTILITLYGIKIAQQHWT